MATIRPTTAVVAAAAALLVATALVAEAAGPPPAPGPTPADCTGHLLNISDCLSYVEADSNTTQPEKGCCGELAALVATRPICLCQLLSKAGSFGVQISLAKALNLTSVCAVTAPPPDAFCSAAGYVIGATTPSEAPGMSPEGPAPAVNPSAAVSADTESVSGVSSIAVFQPWRLVLVGLAVAFL
ncbi:non-specific lipid transfer protein GPI-anchored 11-like [Diospyros lotus]|uniref:non-specific lipid transfer protein GPI-anchored 11-like n=1 Tax=Diospyros lotus TaxID=55363 RepID=UPI0022547A89|nr:non-specific lipid transfer protein GPI-anchored 11-like [Diospyros lotus]